MIAPFAGEELQAELERTLGFSISSFKPLICVNSVNFKATRASDGFTFTVKCIPDSRKAGYDLIVSHVAALKGTKAPQRVFEETCPATFRGFHLLCLKWCDGAGLFPDRFSEKELDAFLEDYLTLYSALQTAPQILPPYETLKWREDALAGCHGLHGRLLRRVIDAIPIELSSYRPERQRVIHGDLHPGNMTFKDGVLTGFLDVEGLIYGYPAWDIVRYFAFALTKLPFYAVVRRARTWRRFEAAVRKLPFASEDWVVSVNTTLIEQMWKKNGPSGFGVLNACRLCLRARQYARMRRIGELYGRKG